ncbi:uncharacterized protein LOC142048571 [Phalacrocorax aristotelis]|uniref:uncharacterized protein LOC142048571 n=1 Tax=Phalacrocorax aristotelis TaxID=126867 RepID=UPI003F4B99B6
MSSGDDCTRREQPTCPLAGPVPVGWERKVEEGSVCYIRVPLVYLPCPRYPMHLLVMPVQTQMFPVYLQSSLASPSSPSVAPTSTGTPAITTEAPCREGRAPNSPWAPRSTSTCWDPIWAAPCSVPCCWATYWRLAPCSSIAHCCSPRCPPWDCCWAWARAPCWAPLAPWPDCSRACRGTPCVCAHPARAGGGRPGECRGHGGLCHFPPPHLTPWFLQHPPAQQPPGDTATEGAQHQSVGWPHRKWGQGHWEGGGGDREGKGDWGRGIHPHVLHNLHTHPSPGGRGCGLVPMAWVPCQLPEEAADMTVLGWGHP